MREEGPQARGRSRIRAPSPSRGAARQDGLHPVVDDIPHWHVPGNASIVEARARLGPEPLQELFRVVAQPLGHAGDRNVWYHGRWRVMAIDGLRLDVADTEANDTAFERPGHSRGVGSAYPQVQVVGLAETGSHAYVGLALGGCRQGETTLARELLPCLQPDMLCLADRNFFSYDLWRAVGERGADVACEEELALGPRAPPRRWLVSGVRLPLPCCT